MNRLTKQWGNNPAVPCNFDLDFLLSLDKNTADGLQEFFDRLAAYEDTGLEPEDIIGLKNTCDQLHGINDSLFKANQEMGKDLAEWKKAYDEGRMVVLPCKVGDTALVKDRAGVPREMRMEAPDIRFVCTDEDNFCAVTCNRKPDGCCAYRIRNDGSDIGKTVFLTREEAALAGKGGEK